ncbi:MAG TPA: preprotein translocase subunit SecG [Gammaproteobacteria bacterium]|jgi:preprotein translocase subunit SecG|nr:preprotein translocase subunit SecG [Gammaproteobacteria bacterium]
MYQFILLIYVFAAVCIVALVLVQQGKGAAMGAAFGSGASQTMFGSRGSGSFLFRVTMLFMFLFFATCIGLNYMASRAYKQQREFTVPVAPPVVPTVGEPPARNSATVPAAAPTTAVPAEKSASPQNEIPVRK